MHQFFTSFFINISQQYQLVTQIDCTDGLMMPSDKVNLGELAKVKISNLSLILHFDAGTAAHVIRCYRFVLKQKNIFKNKEIDQKERSQSTPFNIKNTGTYIELFDSSSKHGQDTALL